MADPTLPPPPPRAWATLALALAGAYLLLGRLGLLLAIPPGYATAIWPPAGLALAAGLALGWRGAPGIFVGSLLLNVWISDLGHLGWPKAVLLAALIALASTLQALAAGGVIRRLVGYPNPLDQGRDILAFFLLGGPLACWIAPTLGVTTLGLMGEMPWSGFLPNWFTWWSGDSLGAMAFAPLGLLLLGEPKAVWRRRRVTLGIPLALAFLAVVLVFVQVRELEQERSRNVLGRQTLDTLDRLRRTLDQHEQLLKGLQAFCQISGAPEREAFHRYAAHVRIGQPAVQALEWAPVVPGDARAAFEARVRAAGFPTFRVTHREADLGLSSAPARPQHLPLLYIEPFTGNEAALGLDLLMEPARQATLDTAARTRSPQASPPIHLVQARSGPLCVSLALPVHGPGEVLRGYVLGVFRLQDSWTQSLGTQARANAGLHYRLSDVTDPKAILPLLAVTAEGGGWAGGQVVPPPVDLGSRRVHGLTFGGRTWELEAYPTPEALSGPRSWEAWATLAAGSFFCGLLAALLLATTARAHFIEQQVEEQTRTLRAREADLSQASRLLDQSQAAAGVGGWELDLATGHLYWTEETYRLHGVAARLFQPTLERALSFIDPASLPQVEQALQQGREHGEPWSLEIQLMDGPHRRWVEFTGRAERHGEQATRLFGSYQDITHRHLADQLKNEFISIVSHELRTPLTALKGSLGLIRQAQSAGDPALLSHLLDIADRNNDRLGALVGDLLDMEKVRSGKLDLVLAPLDLQELVDRTVQETQAFAERLGVRLKQADQVQGVQVQADGQRLGQVLANLLSNAAKFSPAGGRVVVSVTPVAGHRVRVLVADQGPGIPEAFHIRVFEPFAQADSSDRRAKGGTGLGLSISKALMERMGGAIGFTSVDGQGTTFWIELPVTDF